MKRTHIFLAAPAILALLFSCGKSESSQPGPAAPTGQSASSPASPGQPASAAPVQDGSTGYVLRVNASFYTLETDTGAETDKTKWADSMSLGEKVFIQKTRRATFSDKKVYDFTEIRREKGQTGLAFTSHLAEGERLAVITGDDANIYKSSQIIDVTGSILPRKTVLVFFPETTRNNFVEFKAYDPAAQRTWQNYIRDTTFSVTEDDVQSSILLQTALSLKNEGTEKVRRDALLKSALSVFPRSIFSEEIEALVYGAAGSPVKTESFYTDLTVNDNDVNVRDKPGTGGAVLGKLTSGTEVMVSERTSAEYTIDGQTDRWYHITAPMEGWIFGAFLE